MNNLNKIETWLNDHEGLRAIALLVIGGISLMLAIYGVFWFGEWLGFKTNAEMTLYFLLVFSACLIWELLTQIRDLKK